MLIGVYMFCVEVLSNTKVLIIGLFFFVEEVRFMRFLIS